LAIKALGKREEGEKGKKSSRLKRRVQSRLRVYCQYGRVGIAITNYRVIWTWEGWEAATEGWIITKG
jgi:hypothetical protein